MIELLDPRKAWAKIKANSGGVFFQSLASKPKLTVKSGIPAMTSEALTDGFSGKTFSERKKK